MFVRRNQRWALLHVLCLFAIGCTVGCNSDRRSEESPDGWTESRDVSTDSDTAALDAAEPNRDGAEADSAAPKMDGASDADAVRDADGGEWLKKEALIAVHNYPGLDHSNFHYFAQAYFSEAESIEVGGCEVEREGACELRTCPRDLHDVVPAGTVTVETPDRTIEMDEPGDGLYVERDEEPLWENEGPVRISTSGDEVPAFDVESRAISSVTLTRPELPEEGEPKTIPRDEPLQVRWEKIDRDGVDFRAFMSSEDDSSRYFLGCEWSADAGEGTVPDVFIDAMVEDVVFLGFRAGHEEVLRAGDWEVVVQVSQVADDGDPSTEFGFLPVQLE